MENSENYFKETKESIERERGKAHKKAIDYELIPETEKLKVTADERDRILNKVRDFFEKEGSTLLTKEEESILKEIAGVYYNAYKKKIETLNEKKEGRDDYDR